MEENDFITLRLMNFGDFGLMVSIVGKSIIMKNKNGEKNMGGHVSDMRFNPSREVCDNDNNRLFGFIVRRQGPKLVSKTKLMAAIAENVMKKQGIDRVCVVDIKDVNQQLVKHNIDPKRFDIEKKQDVTVEVEDWVRGGFIPVDFTMGVTNADNGIVKDGK